MKTTSSAIRSLASSGVLYFGFVMLGLSSAGLAAPWPFIARPDAGMLAGVDSGNVAVTEGTETGNLAQFYWSFHEPYRWRRQTTQIATGGLFRLDYWLNRGKENWDGTSPNLSILLFRPPSRDSESSFDESDWQSALAFQREPLGKSVPQSHRSQKALRAVEEALSGAQLFLANAPLYEFRGTSNAMEFTAQLPASFPGVGESGQWLSRRVKIFHELGKGKSPGCKCAPVLLVLEHTPLLPIGHAETARMILANDTFLFAAYYLDGATMQWTNSWTRSNSLPRQVDVSLILWPSGELGSRTITLPSTPVPRALQAAAETNNPSVPVGQPARTQLRLPRAEKYDLELDWLGRSGAELAAYILARERAEHPQFDALNQHWAGGHGGSSNVAHIPLQNFPLGGGTISLRIVDLDRKFNINLGLFAPEIVQQALILVGVDGLEIPSIVEAIQDWQDANDTPRANGAESDYYLSLNPPYTAKNGPIDDLAELLVIKGLTPELVFGTNQLALNDLFTAVSGGRVNFNTARAEVMQLFPAIDVSDAEAIIDARNGYDLVAGTEDDQPFFGPADVAAKVPNLSPQAKEFLISPNANQFISGVSTVFEVSIDVELGNEARRYVAWLQRSGSVVRTLKFLRVD